MRLFLNGAMVQEQPACSTPPCGNIVYPSTSSTGDECCGHAELTLGSYRNAKLGQKWAHSGVMSHARIMRKALSSSQCETLFRTRLKQTAAPVPRIGLDQADYWVNAPGALRSPSFDFSSSTQTEEIVLLGNFLAETAYQLIFTPAGPAAGGLSAGLRIGDCLVPEATVSRLLCTVPGATVYVATTLSLQKLSEHSVWQQVWSKMCHQSACGFVPYNYRTLNSHWWTDETRVRSDLSGALAFFRFTTPSVVFERNGLSGALHATQVLGAASACLAHTSVRAPYQVSASPQQDGSCAWNARTCSAGIKQGAPCSLDADCAGQVCSDTQSFKVKGVSKVTALYHRDEHLVFVSNFWDGLSLDVSSLLYRLQPTLPGYRMDLVQEIPTQGARDALALLVSCGEAHTQMAQTNMTVLSIANFGGTVILYKMQNSSTEPIDTSLQSMLELSVTSSTALASFHVGSRLVLVVSCFSSGNTAPSALFEISATSDRQMVARHLTQVITPGALDVEVLVGNDGSIYLFFALGGTHTLSPLYLVQESRKGVKLQLQQQVPCEGARSAQYFKAGAPYLVVAEATHVVVYRFNGTALFSDLTSHTLPKDAASGQTLPLPHAQALLILSPVSALSNVHLLVGTKHGASAHASLAQHHQNINTVWSARHEYVESMRAPTALAVTSDGAQLLVATSGSRSVVIFARNASTGMPHLIAGAGYLSNFTLRGLDRNDAHDRNRLGHAGLTKEQLGFPLRGVSAIALSPDDLFVYTTCSSDNLVAAFMLDATSGAMTLVQVVAEAPNVGAAGGPLGLLGARALAFSTSGDFLYVAGWRGHSLSVWHREASGWAECPGCLSFVDRLRQGERRANTFRDVPARLSGASPWRLPSDSTLSAADGVTMVIAGIPHVAIALGPLSMVHDTNDGSGVVVYRVLDYSSPSQERLAEELVEDVLTFVQKIPVRAAALSSFSMAGSDGERYYLLVASALSWSSASGIEGGQVTLFGWNHEHARFDVESEVPLPPDASGQPLTRLYATSMHAFRTVDANERLVAIAYTLTEGSDVHAPVCVYRWVDKRPLPRRPDGTAVSPRLGLLQCLPASGALKVDSTVVRNRQLLVVISAGRTSVGRHAPNAGGGQIDVFALHVNDKLGLTFSLEQSIAGEGVSDASLVSIDTSVGDPIVLLVVGIRSTPGQVATTFLLYLFLPQSLPSYLPTSPPSLPHPFFLCPLLSHSLCVCVSFFHSCSSNRYIDSIIPYIPTSLSLSLPHTPSLPPSFPTSLPLPPSLPPYLLTSLSHYPSLPSFLLPPSLSHNLSLPPIPPPLHPPHTYTHLPTHFLSKPLPPYLPHHFFLTPLLCHFLCACVSCSGNRSTDPTIENL